MIIIAVALTNGLINSGIQYRENNQRIREIRDATRSCAVSCCIIARLRWYIKSIGNVWAKFLYTVVIIIRNLDVTGAINHYFGRLIQLVHGITLSIAAGHYHTIGCSVAAWWEFHNAVIININHK